MLVLPICTHAWGHAPGMGTLLVATVLKKSDPLLPVDINCQ